MLDPDPLAYSPPPKKKKISSAATVYDMTSIMLLLGPPTKNATGLHPGTVVQHVLDVRTSVSQLVQYGRHHKLRG